MVRIREVAFRADLRVAFRGELQQSWPIGRVIEGKWVRDDAAMTNQQGRFVRRETTFREQVTADGSGPYAVEAGRYHLYVAHACPWAHRVLITRALLGLESAIGASYADPLMLHDGWVFTNAQTEGDDPNRGVDFLWEVYIKARPDYNGRATVPVLWDRKTGKIVNNESRELIRMLNTNWTPLHRADAPTLAPEPLQSQIDEAIDAIYQPINNGVYRAGFASAQDAHEEAIGELFSALDHWEAVLGRQRWVCGDQMTEADICLFTTLFRFDPVYVTHFKCNVRRLVDYPNLWGFVREMYQMPQVSKTCDIAKIKDHYFRSHTSVNPRQLVPLGPILDYSAPHGREHL